MKQIFWVGDSTVAYNNILTFPQTGIGQVFHLYCKKEYRVSNYGKNGASSKSFYDSGLFGPIMESIKEGDYLFVQFGHNDEKPKPDRYTEPFTSYKEYLMKYVKYAREKKAYPMLITPLSRRLFKEDGTIEESHTDYPKAMIELAKEENIPYIDLCQSSKIVLEKAGDLSSREWFMYFPKGTYDNYKKDMTDNTHLHYKGAVVMAGLVAAEMRQLEEIYAGILIEERDAAK